MISEIFQTKKYEYLQPERRGKYNVHILLRAYDMYVTLVYFPSLTVHNVV